MITIQVSGKRHEAGCACGRTVWNKGTVHRLRLGVTSAYALELKDCSRPSSRGHTGRQSHACKQLIARQTAASSCADFHLICAATCASVCAANIHQILCIPPREVLPKTEQGRSLTARRYSTLTISVAE